MKVKRKPPYRVCPECGCSLDRNERCDCQNQYQQKHDNPDYGRIAKRREAFEHYMDDRQREWLWS